MFITKKHIPRRTFLRGAGVTLALPLLDSMIPAAHAAGPDGGQPDGPLCRRSSFRTAWRPATAVPTRRAPAAEFPLIFKPLEPYREQVVILNGLHCPVGGSAAGTEPGRPLGGVGVHVREQTEADRRRGPLQRHDDRSDHRAEDRPGQPDAVDAARRRGPGRELEQLRRRLQLRVHEQHLVVDADDAAADGAQPAGGLRAHVRGRQHGRRAGRAPGTGPQHSRLADGEPVSPARRHQRRPIAAGSTSMPRTCARSSDGCRSP